MRTAMMRAALIAGIIPLVIGCATRGSVRELESRMQGGLAEHGQRVTGLEGRLSQEGDRVASLEGRLGQESQRVSGLEEKIGATAETVRDAQSRADAAFGRADAAFARADEVDGRLTRLWNNRHNRSQVDTVNVHFGFDKADLNDAAQTALASLVKELQSNPRLGVELHGFTDPQGPTGYNLELSRRRVEAVRRYLVQKGVELPRINMIGLGPITDGGTNHAAKRRVTVRMMLQAD